MPIGRKFLKILDLVLSNPRPKYARLSEAIEQAIERGEWKPGEKLPTESALAEVTPFSLGTVRRAYRQFVDFGTVEGRQGAGSFFGLDLRSKRTISIYRLQRWRVRFYRFRA